MKEKSIFLILLLLVFIAGIAAVSASEDLQSMESTANIENTQIDQDQHQTEISTEETVKYDTQSSATVSGSLKIKNTNQANSEAAQNYVDDEKKELNIIKNTLNNYNFKLNVNGNQNFKSHFYKDEVSSQNFICKNIVNIKKPTQNKKENQGIWTFELKKSVKEPKISSLINTNPSKLENTNAECISPSKFYVELGDGWNSDGDLVGMKNYKRDGIFGRVAKLELVHF